MEQRNIAYYYNGTIKPEETDVDYGELLRIPSEGDVLVRPGGKEWRVEEVVAQYRDENAPPTYLVYLTDAD